MAFLKGGGHGGKAEDDGWIGQQAQRWQNWPADGKLGKKWQSPPSDIICHFSRKTQVKSAKEESKSPGEMEAKVAMVDNLVNLFIQGNHDELCM